MKKVLYNGKVYLEKGHFAQALLIEDGRIAAVGTDREILAASDGAEKTDCRGMTVLPGFNDAHLHIMEFGRNLFLPALHGCRSADEIVSVCRAFMEAHPDRRSLVAVGWNEFGFTDGNSRLPDRHDADAVSETVPVLLRRVCGHMGVANTVLLRKLGFLDGRRVQGGTVELGEDGLPDGRLTEMALIEAENALPKATPEELAAFLAEGMQYAVSHGITTVQSNDAGTVAPPEDVFRALDILYGQGKAPLRYVSQNGFWDIASMKAFLDGPYAGKSLYGGMLKYGPVKMFKDGSLGARSAMLRGKYMDDPKAEGVERITDEEQLEMIRCAAKHGTQVVTHCIGDLAIEKTMRLYREANGGAENLLRHSIIHFQITDPGIIEYMRENHLLINVQPAFLEYDIHICDERVGKELGSTSYCFRSAYEAGIHTSFSSDCPIEDCNPFCGIYCAVTRQDYDGKPEGGWNPQECVSLEDAIDMFTAESAYHEFAEQEKGRLKPGYLADLTVIDRDVFSCSAADILKIEPVLTMVGGRTVFRKEALI